MKLCNIGNIASNCAVTDIYQLKAITAQLLEKGDDFFARTFFPVE